MLIVLGMMGLFFVMFRINFEIESLLMRNLSNRRAYMQTAVWRNFDANATRTGFAAAASASAAADLQFIGRTVPVFNDIFDEDPIDVLPLHIVKILEQRGDWKYVNTGSTAKWINTAWVLDEVLMDIPSFNQQALGLPTGCEIVALAMLINKYTDIDVFTLVEQMPRSYDPWLGFRGDPFTRYGFTILPPALLALTEYHIGSAKDMTGASVSDVQAQLSMGRPVLAWVRGMFGFNVHVITLTGFNQYGFYYNDPWIGNVNAFITYDYFLSMWEDPILDMRLNRSYPIRMALSY